MILTHFIYSQQYCKAMINTSMRILCVCGGGWGVKVGGKVIVAGLGATMMAIVIANTFS